MVDLSIIYSKTSKGLRARNASVAELSSYHLKILSFVDGISKAEKILIQSNEFTEKELVAALRELEKDGYIRPATSSSKDDWALTANFTPMVVEEFANIDDIEAEALAKLEKEKALEAKRIADEKTKEKLRWKAEIKARKEAEAAEKVRLEQQRTAQEALDQKKREVEQNKLDDEICAKAKEQAELNAQSEATRKAQEEADAAALAEAKDNARREIERINREAAQAQKKAEEQVKIKEEEARLEAERLEKAEQVRLEAERVAKAENDAQLAAARKAKAELKAQEAAAQARAELAEKEKADAEAKENARLEMARILSKAEEDRKLAEIAAKEARLQAKRKIKTEEQARFKAARKAKDDGEKARINAKEAEIALQKAAQVEMERIAHEAEESEKITQAIEKKQIEQTLVENARLEAEQQAALKVQEEAQKENQQLLAEQEAQQTAARIRAKIEADEKSASEAKALARQEMARIAKEADILRSQTESTTVTKSDKNGRFEASRNAKLKKTTLESQSLESQKSEAEKKAQITITTPVLEKENRGYLEETHQDSQHAATLQAKKSTQSLLMRLSDGQRIIQALIKLVKTTLIYVSVLTLLLIGLLHLVNISPLIVPIEKLSADSIGKPVHIKQVHASLWPQPHIVLDDVVIGDVGNASALKASSVQIILDSSSLFEDVKQVKSLTINGLVVEQSNLEESLQFIQNIGKAPKLKIAQLNLGNSLFKIKDLVLGTFDGNLVLNEAHALSYVSLHSKDHTLTVQIKPQDAQYNITLTGTNWPLPLNPNIVFDELKANASIYQNQMIFNQINGVLYGGNMTAKALLDWSTVWSTTGSFTLRNANTHQLLKAFASKASVEGKVSLTGDFASQSAEVAKLCDTPILTTSIEIRKGKINGVDLAHPVMFNQDVSLAGEFTDFDKLTASLQVKDAQYHYKQITLESSQFHAKGNVDITQNQAISGRVSATLIVQSRHLQSDFGLGGTTSNVKRQ